MPSKTQTAHTPDRWHFRSVTRCPEDTTTLTIYEGEYQPVPDDTGIDPATIIIQKRCNGPASGRDWKHFDQIVRDHNTHADLIGAVKALSREIRASKGKMDIRKDFSLINTLACASKLIHGIETGEPTPPQFAK
jgi:hypothetical protein